MLYTQFFITILSLFCAAKTIADNETKGCNIKIAVLGDSYSSGTGARDEDGDRNYDDPEGGCFRSPSGWAGQFSRYLSEYYGANVSFFNHACYGAHIADGRPKQIVNQVDQLDQDTNIVLLTAGGNDMGFFNIVMDCFVLKSFDKCQQWLSEASDGLDAKGNDVKDLLNQINEKTQGNAKVILLGYPLLVLNDLFFFVSKYEEVVWGGVTFWEETDRYEADEYVRSMGTRYDSIQAKAVQDANEEVGTTFATFVSIQELFDGHEIDPQIFWKNPDTWMQEIEWDTFPDWTTCWQDLGACWDEFFDLARLELSEMFHIIDEGHDQIALYLQDSVDASLFEHCSEQNSKAADPSFAVMETPGPAYNNSSTVNVEGIPDKYAYCPFAKNLGVVDNTCDSVYGLYTASSSLSIDIVNGPLTGVTGEAISIKGSVVAPTSGTKSAWSVLNCVGKFHSSSSNCNFAKECKIDDPRAINTTVTCSKVGVYTLTFIAQTPNGDLVGRDTKLTIRKPTGEKKKYIRTRKPPTRQ